MDLETFEKLVEKHLFILESHKLDKSGMPKLQIFGIEALYKQLMLANVVEQSEQFYCDGQENNKDRCKTQCLGCAEMQKIYGQ